LSSAGADLVVLAGSLSVGLLVVFVASIYLAYYGYVIRLVRNRPSSRGRIGNNADLPRISVIVPTFNEETTIDGKLNDLLSQGYPLDHVEVLVMDSGSTDRTCQIVQAFIESHRANNIRLLRESVRRGKSAAVNIAFHATSSKSELVVMTDSDSRFGKDSLRHVAECFTDPKVGLVTGMKSVLNPDESSSTRLESTYRKYYRVLREGESRLDSTPISDGELIACRRSIAEGVRIRENVNADDTQLAILTRRMGFRAICNPEATFGEFAPTNSRDLFKQKIRRGQGIIRTFWANRDLLFDRDYGKFGTVVFPMNFFMHIASPLLVVSIGMVAFVMLVTRPSVYILISLMFLAIAVILGAKGKGPLSSLFSFLYYQLVLFLAMLLAIAGHSLHKWEKIDSVRTPEKWATADSNNSLPSQK
jgi:cellulose synthase/poly-beta-1,6-N-acetylglucosamine synthase-like glycosyltransferase